MSSCPHPFSVGAEVQLMGISCTNCRLKFFSIFFQDKHFNTFPVLQFYSSCNLSDSVKWPDVVYFESQVHESVKLVNLEGHSRPHINFHQHTHFALWPSAINWHTLIGFQVIV